MPNSSTFHLKLNNWRCYKQQDFYLPQESFVILDQNGSGKTSLIASLFSLLTKNPWPSTKFFQHLQSGSDYFGIQTQTYPGFFLNGKINPSGRLSLKYQQVDKSLNLFSQNIDSDNWPKIVTYSPHDNLWFISSRTKKIEILDSLLEHIWLDYKTSRHKLNQLIRQKTKVIKDYQENPKNLDQSLFLILNRGIWQESIQIWKFRKEFFSYLNQNLREFSSWIESSLLAWSVIWSISDLWGRRVRVQDYNYHLEPSLNDWQNLLEKELSIGKVLFGAQRDDFDIQTKHLSVADTLSRGETRMLILFIKKLVLEKIKFHFPNNQLWFFVDDIFNELDQKRDQILLNKVLSKADVFIGTTTKKLDLACTFVNLKQLKS